MKILPERLQKSTEAWRRQTGNLTWYVFFFGAHIDVYLTQDNEGLELKSARLIAYLPL